MSIYGEGADEPGPAAERTREQLERGEWEPRGANGEQLEPVPTPETKEPALASVYALTKYDQERMCLLYGAAYDVPAVALRFFNVYGPRQALSNPYTGVLAIFASRLLNDQPRWSTRTAASGATSSTSPTWPAPAGSRSSGRRDGERVNIGSGRSSSVLEIARGARARARQEIEPEIRASSPPATSATAANVTRAREALGFEAEVPFEQGLAELAEWLRASRRLTASTKPPRSWPSEA